MPFVRAGLRRHQHLAAAGVAVLRVEIRGQHAKTIDGIKVGHNGRAHVHVLFHIRAVHAKAVRVLALPADREISRIRVARRRSSRHTGHDHRARLRRVHRHDSRLHRHQVGKAAAVQRYGLHFFRLQRLSQLRARGLSRQRICRHLHGFRTAVHYQRHVQIGAGRIGAHRCLATVNRKIRHSHLDLVGVCGGNDELKAALPIGLLSERCGVGWVGLAQRDHGAGNDAAGCVVHHTGDAKASRRLRPQPKREDRET